MPLETIQGTFDDLIRPLQGRTVSVLGYGNQGSAHAQNLRDSGVSVLVANRPDSANGRRAIADGFDLHSIRGATEAADLVVVALPDEVQPTVWAADMAPVIRAGSVVGFMHGFAVHYGGIEPGPDIGVVMVAPKGPGSLVRSRYVEGLGLPALLAVHQETSARDAEPLARAWAAGIGSLRAAIIRTTFANETETDLFGEQSVLCGGMTALMIAAFETLVDAGYPPALAYMECCQEVKQVADLVYARGIAGMMKAISNTAEFGAYNAGDAIADADLRAQMRDILASVRDGSFAGALARDHAEGFPWFETQRRNLAAHPIERAGAEVRGWMPWLTEPKDDVT